MKNTIEFIAITAFIFFIGMLIQAIGYTTGFNPFEFEKYSLATWFFQIVWWIITLFFGMYIAYEEVYE